MQGLNELIPAIWWFGVLAVPVILLVLALSLRPLSRGWSRDRFRTALLDVAVGLSLLGVAVVVLVPVGAGETGFERGLQLRPLTSIIDVLTASVDASVVIRLVVFNILLFVPLGYFLAVRVRSLEKAVLAVFGLSILIETLQAVLPLGRTTNVDDIILNTLGAVLGGLMTLLGVGNRQRA